jgi:hypothetical protein
MVDVDSIETELEAVALVFVLTFMPCPPSRGVMFMGLVTGLRPLRSAVAREVSLARTSDGLCPLGTAPHASSSGIILTCPPQVIIGKSTSILAEITRRKSQDQADKADAVPQRG